MKDRQILLDMDGVLADFLSGSLEALNKAYNKAITLEQYAKEWAKWETYDYYGITIPQFWQPINETKNFWINLKPFPWYEELYGRLIELGNVTIVTAPSADPDCAKEKLQWLDKYLGIESDAVFLGHRKYLMAGNGILIDDYHKNVSSFKENGGQAILVPSNWNTPGLTFEMIWSRICKDYK